MSITRREFVKTSAAVSAAAVIGCQMMTPAVHAAGDQTIKIGLVGCGGRGRGALIDALTAAEDLKVKAQVIAIADLFPDRIEETKKMWAERPKEQYDLGDRTFSGFDAYKKLLATDVNYVILATPPGFRPFMTRDAIAAGKHVFIEKPVAVDSPGCRMIMEAAEEATKKNLGIVVGTQRRHQPSYIEVIKRLQDGALGKILGGQVYWIQEGTRMVPREAGWSDTEWQLRNWWYFTWLSGDHIVEQHMHQHDVANWVLGGPPKLCIATGGRQVRTDPAYGHIYDHFAVDYEYAGGVHVTSMCRQQDRTYGRVSEFFIGQKGTCIAQTKIMSHDNEEIYKFEGGQGGNPYMIEHRDLIQSILAGKPLNEGARGAEGTITAIMGRMSAYTGKLVTFRQALADKTSLWPEKLEFGPMPMPPVAMPGQA